MAREFKPIRYRRLSLEMQKTFLSILSRKICWQDGFRTVDPAAPVRSNEIRKEKDLHKGRLSSGRQLTLLVLQIACRNEPFHRLIPSLPHQHHRRVLTTIATYIAPFDPVSAETTVIVDVRVAKSCLFVDRLTVFMVWYLTRMVPFIYLRSHCEICWLIIFKRTLH